MTKVKNDRWIKSILPAIFLQFSQGFVLSQIPGLPARLNLEICLNDTAESSQKYSSPSPGKLMKKLQKSLRYWQDNGFPFASFKFDTIVWQERDAGLRGRILPGPRILNGPLMVHGDSSISPSFLCRWLGYPKDEPFSCARADLFQARCTSLPFAECWKPAEVEWFGNQSVLHVYLRRNSPGFANGILGIMPSQTGGSPLLTGNIEAGFSDLFRQGIDFRLQWTRFARSSQTARLEVKVPAITAGGMSVTGRFDLFRQDSLFFRQSASAEAGLRLRGLWEINSGLQAFSSSQRSRDGEVSQTVSSLVLGLSMESGRENHIDPDRRQFSFFILPGLRQKKESGIITRYSRLEVRASASLPVLHSAGRFRLRSAAGLGFLSSGGLNLADQFRMGGLRSLRGFNENQFFTRSHLFLSLQPQWLLDPGFLLGLFCEGMGFQSNLSGPLFYHVRAAMGFGISAEFEAGNNLVQVSVANGLMEGLYPGFSTSKIHFGYVARF